jgi:hypothetical protein
MRPGSLIASIFFLMIFEPVAALSGPAGVWIPGNANSVIERIHIAGPPFNYTATIDYRCAMGVCSTLQSLIEDNASPPTYSVPLEGVGPAPVLELRWQKGSPCNRAASDENPLTFWVATSQAGKTQARAVGRTWCFVRPPASPSTPRH